MSAFEEPTEEKAGGFSRREFFLRLGGGLAGVTLASYVLDAGPKPAAAAGTSTSVRDLLRRISNKGCDVSQGIRAVLPNDHPVISLRDVAGRYAGHVVNFCQPLGFSVRTEALAGGGLTAYLTGTNFTGGGMAAIQYTSDIARDDRSFSVPVRPDGTFATVFNLGCTAPGLALYGLFATDTATGRASTPLNGQYTCPQSMPPPPPAPKRPSIMVSQSSSTFTVKGTGFLPNHTVYVRAVDATTLIQYSAGQTTSDGSGAINYTVSAPCNKGFSIDWSANDGRSVPPSQDITGIDWSNTVTTVCQ
jgi:hypothetical protein